MANKFIRVNINHKGFIPILGCFGPVKNILLTEIQVNNLKRIIGADKIELVNKPKKVISPRQAEEIRRGRQPEPQPVEEVKPVEVVEEPKPQPEPVEEVVEEVKPVEVVEEPKPQPEPIEEVVEEQPKPAPKRRGGRKPAPKKVEEEQPVEVVEE